MQTPTISIGTSGTPATSFSTLSGDSAITEFEVTRTMQSFGDAIELDRRTLSKFVNDAIQEAVSGSTWIMHLANVEVRVNMS